MRLGRLGLAELARQQQQAGDEDDADAAPAISHSAGWKPTSSSSRPPTKKPTPFIAFFEPVNQATHLNSWPLPSADVALIADFDAVLVKSLATPAMPCATTTQATEARRSSPDRAPTA